MALGTARFRDLRHVDTRLSFHRRQAYEEYAGDLAAHHLRIGLQRGRAFCQRTAAGLGWAGIKPGVDQVVGALRVSYWLEADGDLQHLNHVQWADWDREGQLLVATRWGKLQTWNLDVACANPLFEEDLSLLEPNPTPAPAWAHEW